ncbi:hypothetical protein ACZ90_11825 [Streptomyces albus subsp. albus]|uniref:hypothetical protein n=1 Tax=Streptomyces TaxID=1883 RepID=UPI0004BDABD9|nr:MULTISPECIES: hypothetical protein [Streptomyces]KOG78757.1 hypothetical protein ADK33_25945 [Streptomyces griseus subsp. rhodochrous]KUJ69386.1 hypothetical protein ACZ90_11825 [Streptomyces albus subsp. albus]
MSITTTGRSVFKAESLADAVEYAKGQLAIADNVNYGDPGAVAYSQGGLAATLRRVLWALGEEEDFRDRAAEVPNEVAAEDGVRSIGIPFQRKQVAA